MNSIKPVEELTFTDDFMFTTIMKDKEICKELLERLLKINVSNINYPVAQKSLAPFFETKGVRLDVYVDDGKRVFDIEIQTYIPEAIGKRMRYYQSILDMDSLQKGSVYTELKETYILFICTNDPFGKDLPVYTFKNRCIEDGEVSNDDKSTKVIYNATSYAKEKDSQIRAFLQYLCNRSSTDDFTNKISLMWQTPANIKEDYFNIDNGLILNCKNDADMPLNLLPNLLLTKILYKEFTIKAKLSLHLENNSETGLVFMGKEYGYICVKRENNTNYVLLKCGKFKENDKVLIEKIYDGKDITFNLEFDNGNYRLGYNNHYFDYDFKAYPGMWIGSKYGIYARGDNGYSKCYSFKCKKKM